VDTATEDTLMQVIGVSAAIVPALTLMAWLAIGSRRRQAAERAELAEQPPKS
jgi:hypothetical protein